MERVKTNEYGEVILDVNDVFESLYAGNLKNLDQFRLDNKTVVAQFNKAVSSNADSLAKLTLHVSPELDLSEFDRQNQEYWFMPEEYSNMDIEGFLVNACPKQNYERLIEELVLFRQHNMIPLLKYLKYLVDTMRSNNIVWGVGRGSSVASYCLYLLGVHKIDSIKYELDINEFLK